jgi:hypothetical protein
MSNAIGLDHLTVTILSGASLSDIIAAGARVPIGIVMPAAWTAAALTFQVSADGGTTWNNLYDSDGTEVTVIAAAAHYIALDANTFVGINHLKVRSGTSGSPVTQGADRALILVTKD